MACAWPLNCFFPVHLVPLNQTLLKKDWETVTGWQQEQNGNDNLVCEMWSKTMTLWSKAMRCGEAKERRYGRGKVIVFPCAVCSCFAKEKTAHLHTRAHKVPCEYFGRWSRHGHSIRKWCRHPHCTGDPQSSDPPRFVWWSPNEFSLAVFLSGYCRGFSDCFPGVYRRPFSPCSWNFRSGCHGDQGWDDTLGAHWSSGQEC